MASFLEILDGVNKATTTLGNTADSISRASQVFAKTQTAPVNQNPVTTSGGSNGLVLLGLAAFLLLGKKL